MSGMYSYSCNSADSPPLPSPDDAFAVVSYLDGFAGGLLSIDEFTVNLQVANSVMLVLSENRPDIKADDRSRALQFAVSALQWNRFGIGTVEEALSYYFNTLLTYPPLSSPAWWW